MQFRRLQVVGAKPQHCRLHGRVEVASRQTYATRRLWNAQTLYHCCRRHRLCEGKGRLRSGEVHDLLDGRWRDQMRTKILELKSYGVYRYDDITRNLNEEGISTRLGKPWTTQAVYRLMRTISLQTGKSGRRRHEE